MDPCHDTVHYATFQELVQTLWTCLFVMHHQGIANTPEFHGKSALGNRKERGGHKPGLHWLSLSLLEKQYRPFLRGYSGSLVVTREAALPVLQTVLEQH